MSTRKRRPNTIQKERVKIPAITQRETPQKPPTFRREKVSQIPNFVKRIAKNAPVYNNRNNGLYYYELLESLDSSQSQRKDLCLTNPFFIVNFYSKKDRKTWVLSFFL